MTAEYVGVHQHTVLAWRGGAARIARMLDGAVQAAGWETAFTCEIADDGATPVAVPPDNLTEGHLLHLHGAQNWNACLRSVVSRGIAPLITLHDCSLLTGGCPYPLTCSGLRNGCPEPCPRGFPSAASVQRERRAALMEATDSGALLVSPSRWLRHLVQESLPEVPCRHIPNGVEAPYFSMRSDGAARAEREAARARFGLTPQARLVLFMAHGGEAAAYKSGDRWHALWQQIQQQVPGAVCYMVGGESVRKNGSVLYWPYVNRETARQFMSAADCFAYPSLADNHPLVVLEALSLGCPVVAFAVGGIPEQIVHGVSGALVPAGRWQDFSAACVDLLRDSAARRAFARGGRDVFRRSFTQERMAREYIALYTERGLRGAGER